MGVLSTNVFVSSTDKMTGMKTVRGGCSRLLSARRSSILFGHAASTSAAFSDMVVVDVILLVTHRVVSLEIITTRGATLCESVPMEKADLLVGLEPCFAV